MAPGSSTIFIIAMINRISNGAMMKTKDNEPSINNQVKSPKTVMPNLILHPQHIEFTEFPLSRE